MEQVHQPEDVQAERLGRFRLKFEEFLFLQLLLVQHRNQQTTALPGPAFAEVGEQFNRFYSERIPFELTGAQKRVIREIREDTRNGTHMNRLLQGDVGSGKTMVALLTALLAVDNGCQACIMAPTEILAQQHLASFKDMLGDLPVRVELLTGSVKAADRKPILDGLADGDVHLLIGTHAVLEPKVVFHRLGLVVIDEQHRFGVAQRARLWAKAEIPPHILVMTATPIPRTLSMTVYGDLDVSIIDELPPGRKPIRTVHRTDAQRLGVFGFMRDQIAEGRQVYVVYPLIEESAQLDHKDLMDGYESLTRHFPAPDHRISIVHGRMKPEDKDAEMQRFAQGQTQIMVATTVIEVGVNVPNASVMVIESATRFGLSQLHQLRGRVGRGANQSFCILMSDKELGKEARRRLETMVRTQDGFEIAEVDLELRGPRRPHGYAAEWSAGPQSGRPDQGPGAPRGRPGHRAGHLGPRPGIDAGAACLAQGWGGTAEGGTPRLEPDFLTLEPIHGGKSALAGPLPVGFPVMFEGMNAGGTPFWLALTLSVVLAGVATWSFLGSGSVAPELDVHAETGPVDGLPPASPDDPVRLIPMLNWNERKRPPPMSPSALRWKSPGLKTERAWSRTIFTGSLAGVWMVKSVGSWAWKTPCWAPTSWTPMGMAP